MICLLCIVPFLDTVSRLPVLFNVWFVGYVWSGTCSIYKQSLFFFRLHFEIHLPTNMAINKSTLRTLVVLELIDSNKEKEEKVMNKERQENGLKRRRTRIFLFSLYFSISVLPSLLRFVSLLICVTSSLEDSILLLTKIIVAPIKRTYKLKHVKNKIQSKLKSTFKRLNFSENDILFTWIFVQHVGRARKRTQHHLTKEIRNKMLDECLNCYKLLSYIFCKINVGPTSSSMVRKRIQHSWSNMLVQHRPKSWIRTFAGTLRLLQVTVTFYSNVRSNY